MKVKDIKVGEIFVIDNTIARPKMKINEGFVDMFTLYTYINKDDLDARLVTESEIFRVRSNWRMSPEKFEKYKKMIIKRYIKEIKK